MSICICDLRHTHVLPLLETESHFHKEQLKTIDNPYSLVVIQKMGWFGKANNKGDAVSNGDEASSAPDYMVPDVPNTSDTNNNTNNNTRSDMRSTNKNSNSTKQAPECGKHFCSEINPCQSWFHVKDPIHGRVLDIPESFAPASGYAFLWKVVYCGTCIGTMIWALIDTNSPEFYFAYFTNWGVLWCCLYSFLSVLNTVLASRTGQPAADKSVGLRIRLTWIFLTIAAHGSLTASFLYWPLVFEPGVTNVTYLAIAPHGILLVLTLVDGFYVNRIPLRWMHYLGVTLPLDLAYALWSYLHSALDIGNPDRNDADPSTNDDALYENVLEWNEEWQTALTWAVVTMLVIGPVLFSLLWTLSTGGCCKDSRKYVDDVDPTDDRPTVYDVEEGSVFAKWR